jgi:cytochrome P450
MTEQEYAELWRLRMRWLGIYHVARAGGVWCAKRYHDVTRVLTANTVAGLAEQIQNDYAEPAG